MLVVSTRAAVSEEEDEATGWDGVKVAGGSGSPQTADSHRVTDGARRKMTGDILPLLLFPGQHLLPWTTGTWGLGSEASKQL